MGDNRRETTASLAPPASSSASTKSGDNLPPRRQKTPVSRRRGALKRKASNSSSSSKPSKRVARERANSSLLPPTHNGPLTRARQLSDNVACSSALTAVKNEGTDAPAAQGDVAGACEGYDDVIAKEYEALEAAIEAEYERIQNRDCNAHVVPVPSGWYSWTKIHPIEELALPSFFSDKSANQTPEIYMGIRNWIMRKFHANPNTNIELKDLSDMSIGELEARQEVFEFLELWGLINYHPFPANDISKASENAVTDGNQDAKMDSLIEQLYHFEKEQSAIPLVSKTNLSTPTMPTGLFGDSALAEELVKQEGPAVEYHCNSCSADCSRKRYHCQKQADFDLCSECYNSRKFGSDMSPLDFILMEPGEAAANGGIWTDQETLLLLEALELFKENWNEIAEHVATKTKAQCILQFLQMPIEDTFLDNDAEVKDTVQENASSISVDAPDSSKISGDLSSTIHDLSVAEEASRMSKSQTGMEVQPVPRETSNSGGNQDGKAGVGTGDNIALRALKKAFDLVGSLVTHEDKLSFSEAGNPVMTLATFLAQLVEPGLASASAHCALKSLSGRSTSSCGMQLAARHCYILEDPPDDREDTITDSVSIERDDQVACKEEKQDDKIQDMNHNEEKAIDENEIPAEQNGEEPSDQIREKGAKCTVDHSQNLNGQKSSAVLGGVPVTTDHVDDKIKHSALDDNLPETLQVENKCTEKLQVDEKSDELPDHEQLGPPKVVNEPESSNLLKDQTLNDVKKLDDSALSLKSPQSSMQESKDCKSAIQATRCVETQKDVEMEPSVCIGALKDIGRDPDPLAVAPVDVDMGIDQCGEALKNVDMETDQCGEALKNMDMEQNQKKMQDQAAPNMEVGYGANTGEDKVKDAKDGDLKSLDSKEDPSVDKLKHAAMTTIVAAAVKAKLLAIQEEEEIQQLSALLIDKQLRKLELKLSFFSELENAVMRLRKLLVAPWQKLYNERAQMIVAHLGLAASSSRMMPSALPVNRMVSLPNSMPRPATNLAPQSPSVPRPSMPSDPPTSNSSTHLVAAGWSSTQPSGQ